MDAAIDAFLRGDWVPAIHLAGAAEEIFSRLEEARGGKSIPDFFWEKTGFKDLITKKKDYIRVLNHFRDWVKHSGKNHPMEIEIEEPHVVLSVMRAMLAQEAYTKEGRPSVTNFRIWYVDNIDRINSIVEH